MSALRSTSVGSLATTCKAFTLSVWVRPYESGRQQRIFAIGAAASATPLFALEQDASDNLVLTESATPTATTVLPAAEFQAGRLYHVLASYRYGTLYYRVASKLDLATGTASWPTSLAWASADRCSIGSRHDSAAESAFAGHVFGVYFTTEWLGDVRDADVYGKFERTSGELIGFPRHITPRGPSGLAPQVLFGYTQNAAAWNAGANRGSVSFGAAEGAALTAVGIARRLVASPPYMSLPFEADATYIYSIHHGQHVYRAPVDRSAAAEIVVSWSGVSRPDWKDETGASVVTGGNFIYSDLFKTRSGWLLNIRDATNFRRVYRSADITDWSASLAPVLCLGSDGTDGVGASGTVYGYRSLLGKSTYVVGTFNGAPALYMAEYTAGNDSSGSPVYPGRVWYSVDDGATWAPFWTYQGYQASSANRKFRYAHGIAQFDDGRLAVIMNSNVAGEHSIVIGPTSATWDSMGLADQTVTQIEANATFAAADGVVVRGTYAERGLQGVCVGGWMHYGNEEVLDRSTSGMYAVRSDGTDLTQTHRRPNMTEVDNNRANAGGGIVKFGDHIVSMDYASPWSANFNTPVLEVRTSRDGFFWVPVAKFETLTDATRVNVMHQWNSFVFGDELAIAGTYQNYLAAGSTAESAIVALGAENGLHEELLTLNGAA